MPTLFSIAGLALALVSLHVGAAHATTTVTTCGQTVSGTAELGGDLDCTGLAPPAVFLKTDAKLDLRGFTIHAGLADGVQCESDCRIFSSATTAGTITGADGYGIVVGGGYDFFGNLITGDLAIKNVTVSFSGYYGITVQGGINMESCTVVDNGGYGAVSADYRRPFKVVRSTISRNGGSGVGIGNVRSIVVRDSTLSDNYEAGIFGRNVKVKGSTMTGNAWGILAVGPNVRVGSSTITGNSRAGIEGSADHGSCLLKTSDSTITGNGTDPQCGTTYVCGDLGTCEAPILSATTCKHSFTTGTSGPPAVDWDVCSLD